MRLNVLAAVAPATGVCSALIFDGCDTAVFQLFVDTLAADCPAEPGKTYHLVLDNANWHKAKRLHWHRVTPVYLPLCSPDFNATERLWLHLKFQWFAGFTARTEEAPTHRLTSAIQSLFAHPQLVVSQCRVSAEDF